MRISDNQSLILGPPGTGKTSHVLSEIDTLLQAGESPDRIAFVSFTKKAIAEATGRAGEKFNLKPRQLPMFKTVHAMCFAGLGIGKSDVVGKEHYRELGEWLGYRFEGTWDESEGVPVGSEKGDTLLFLDNLARVQQRPLKEVWEENYHECEWEELERFQEGYQDFKSSKYVMDFTDMLSAYIAMCDPSPARQVIVDEAQDLSSLQWSVLKHAYGNVRQTIIAGDDDQSIYKWSGADVNAFLALEGNKTVLSKSYRLPRSVHEIANGIVQKIENRFDKPFDPRDSEGEVNFMTSLEEVVVGEESTLFLVRNTYLARKVQDYMHRMGIPYTNKYGFSSVRSAHIKAIEGVEKLRKAEPATGAEVKAMYDNMRIGEYLARGFKVKVANLKDTDLFSFAELRNNFGLLDIAPWYNVLGGIGDDLIAYYQRLKANGYNLDSKPNCSISTIHAAKGGEADHVVLLSDMAYRSHQEYVKQPDNERRVAYVGVTRAKEKLSIVLPQSKLFFDFYGESQ
jgi:DNA helicase-2/ATP-dependent DNA helicase PcrA